MIANNSGPHLWFITHQELKNWLESIINHATLIAPQYCDGVVLFKPTTDVNEIAWGDTRPAMSIKEAFFPPTEQLMIVEKRGSEIKITENLFSDKQVIFSLRPCDARGVKVLDSAFITTEPEDSYYSRRRANTALIGRTCQQMSETCFCTSVGGSPSDPGDMDVMLTDTNGGYLVQIVSDKGGELVEGVNLQSTSISLQAEPESARTLAPQIGDWPARFADNYWEVLAERCLSCRICAYVCPTCRCFDVRDEALSSDNGWQEFERIRCWDSCTSEAYRRIAGGHNPRDTKAKRLKNRVFCKFYYYPQQYNPVACTGCGRCIEACPVNIDITEVLQHFMEVADANRA
jgi:sulfhydrogenase subunit beta (sulfur reductase)